MTQDVRGLDLSGSDDATAARYNAIVHDYMDYRASVFGDLKSLCKDAPDFAMAHLLKGYLLLSMGTNGTVPAVEACHQQALQQAESLTPREHLHTQALDAWCRGDTTSACDLWDQILVIAPLDLLAVKLQHFSLFWMGQPDRMRDTCARIEPVWNAQTPGWAYLLGMKAFAMEETGDYNAAERLGLEAVERHPDDLWSLHALAHVYEMQGRLDEGLALFDKPLDTFDDRNPFRGHIWWHAALFALEKGQYDQVFDLYDNAVRAAESTFYLDIQNSVSLLARLDFAGVDVGNRWEELADIAEVRQNDHVLMFTEPHCTMALGRTQRLGLLDDQQASLRTYAKDSKHAAADLIEPLVAPLCDALGDYYRNNHESAADKLQSMRYAVQPIGGSHAQRDVFSLFLIDASIQSGRLPVAQGLLAERVARHPNSLMSWQRYHAVCSELGDTSRQNQADEQIRRLSAAA